MKTGLSWNSLLGQYIIFVRDSELSQKIFANVHPKGFFLIGHPLGKKLFGEHNMIMMQGDEHKAEAHHQKSRAAEQGGRETVREPTGNRSDQRGR